MPDDRRASRLRLSDKTRRERRSPGQPTYLMSKLSISKLSKGSSCHPACLLPDEEVDHAQPPRNISWAASRLA